MKKIKYVKALKDNKFEMSDGYYYKDRNGIEYAIDSDTHYVTELSTGCLVIVQKDTIKNQKENIENYSVSVMNTLSSRSCKKKIELINKYKYEVLKDNNVYIDHGYSDREEYLKELAYEYGVDYSVVLNLANLLGKSEDFDGLISSLEDIENT